MAFREADLAERRPWLLRSLTAALALLLTAGAAARFGYVLRSTELSWEGERLAYLIPAVVAVGALAYALASFSGGAVGLAVRRIGWALMAVPLLIPSTFSLALPLLVPLALTLGDLSTLRWADRTQRSPSG